MAMKFTEPSCAFRLSGSHIQTDKSVTNKVTGTSLAPVLGKSPFTSPFRAACALLGLGREDISRKRSVEIGTYLEDKLIAYCGERYASEGAFIPAADVFAAREGAHDEWASDWEDETFSGHLDGVVASENGNFVLEVKTSGNLDSWADGVPEYYALQVALYNHFMYGQDHAYVILGIVDDEVRKDLSKWVPSDENVFLFKLELDDESFSQTMGQVKEWYDHYIKNGITPDYDPSDPKDVEMWEHLQAISATDDDIQVAVDRLEEVENELARLHETIAPLEEEQKALQTSIKDYMVSTNKMEIVTSSNLMRGVLTRSKRSKLDKTRLIEDGIDLEKYTIYTDVESFSFKKVK